MGNKYEYLERQIKERMDIKKDEIALGKCKDFAEYQKECGVVSGLNFALVEISDLTKANREDNDND